MPVAGDQHRGLFVRKPRLFSLAAAFARLSWQPALAFAAFQNKTLVDLDDAGQLLFQRVFVQAQKTVAPAERGVLGDPSLARRLAHRMRVLERVGEGCPAFLLAQPGQRRASQGV